MTISPPAKVKNDYQEDFIALASGIDTLYLAIDVNWGPLPKLFIYLEDLKAKAKEERTEKAGEIKSQDGSLFWKFTVAPYGKEGYEWLLNGKDFTFKIGNWLVPNSKPSILVEIRSETLWYFGARQSVDLVLGILFSQGATNIKIKPTRADLCVDLLAPADFWNSNLIELKTTKAAYSAQHFKHSKMTGISIGRGNLSARLYDKALEISQQSKKFWMYEIWGITEVPEGGIVIRTEYQLRREALKELAVKSIDDLFSQEVNLWAYCTTKWLKFQTNPGKHHTQRKTLPWWKVVQSGYPGAQGANPLVRCKAVEQKRDQYLSQMSGAISSFIALEKIEEGDNLKLSACIGEIFHSLMKYQKNMEQNGKDFTEIVQTKMAQNARLIKKQSEAFVERQKNGFTL